MASVRGDLAEDDRNDIGVGALGSGLVPHEHHGNENRFGAGDRDRTGDIQLGKLTFPFARFAISYRIRHLSSNLFICNMMQDDNRVHTLHSLHILSHISVDFGQYGQ